MARGINVPITGDASRYMRELRKAQGVTSKFGVAAKAALITGAAAGFYALGKAAKIGWDEFNQGQKVAAQTNAVIKSTGGAANVTAGHVEDLGGELMRLSGIDDEVIKSGENMLLTFRGIHNEVGKGNDIFDQATKATLDLSVAMGKDMQSSAILVGKALNDPIRGMTALRRVGVSLSDSQTALVTHLVETGHKMEAQKIILGELTKEFGGSAKAAGQTLGGQLSILRERFNNFLGMLVGRAIPALQRFAKVAIPQVNAAIVQAALLLRGLRSAFLQVTNVMDSHRDSFMVAAKVIQGVAFALRVVVAWDRIWMGAVLATWIRSANIILTATDKIIGAIRAVIAPIATLVSWLKNAYNWLANVFNRVWTLHVNIPSLPDLPGGGGLLERLRQHGGPVAAGKGYVVGEKGPEWFVPKSSGTIIPNGGSPRMATAGMGGDVRVIVVGGDAQAIRYFNGLFGRDSKRNG